MAAPGLQPETERHNVPHVPGAFALSGVFTRRETAALRAVAHAVVGGCTRCMQQVECSFTHSLTAPGFNP
jgi:hypothetical protein